MKQAFLFVIMLVSTSFVGCLDGTDLSDDNKCYIHTSFSSNDNWGYNWESYCE